MTQARPGRVTAIAIAAAAATATGALGAWVTDLGPWYQALRKPSWQPPDIAFGPAWTLIFALTAASGYVAWRSHPLLPRWARIVALFAANGVFNVLWSTLFFALHRPDWALPEAAVLWLSILALIVTIAPTSAAASWLLVPYLVWVSFAMVLNYAVVQLNYPFAAT